MKKTTSSSRPESARQIGDVAKEIIGLKFKPTSTFASAEQQFYRIMRKHGIKEGMKCGKNCVRKANPEWVACWTLFLSSLSCYWAWRTVLQEVPRDLQCYKGKETET